MEDKAFRVLLDLTEINIGSTELKYVWMHISLLELKTIFDFKRAIVKKFALPQENFKLFVRDGLLLEKERIAILREDDIVKLQYEEESQSTYESCIEVMHQETVNRIEQDEQSNCNSSASCKEPKEKESVGTAVFSKQTSPRKHRKKRKRDKSLNLSEPEKSLNGFQENTRVSLDSSPADKISTKKHKKKHAKENLSCGESLVSSFNKDSVMLCAQEISNNETLQQTCAENEFVFLSPSAISDNRCSKQRKRKSTAGSLERTENTSSFFSTDGGTYVKAPNRNSDISLEYSTSTAKCDISSSLNESSDHISEANQDAQCQKTNNCKKRKRKRKRKRKESEVVGPFTFECDKSFETEASFHVNGNSSNSTSVRKHIKYNSYFPPPVTASIPDGKVYNDTNSKLQVSQVPDPQARHIPANTSNLEACIAAFQLENADATDLKSKVCSLTNKTDMQPRVSTPISRNLFRGEAWAITPHLALMNKPMHFKSDCSTIKKESTKNEINVNQSSKQETNQRETVANDMKKEYADYPPLNHLPTVGTCLAYKTLELNDNYCPEVTEYKEGIVKTVDPNTDDLEIELNQEEIKPGRIGKFENIDEDEIPPPEVIKTVLINWTNMIDPRVISKA